MSWSELRPAPRLERTFSLGLGIAEAPGRAAGAETAGRLGRVSPAPFAALPDPADPPGLVRPMVFVPFGGTGQSGMGADEPAVPAEAEETIPPPDYEAIKAAAWDEGFQQGYEAGLRQAAEEQGEAAARLGALLQGIATESEALVRGLEEAVVELALAVAEKVIAREARLDPSVVVDVVRAALAEVQDAAELRIRVHPDDYPLVEPHWPTMLPRNVAERSELRADELVARGGVVVETDIGHVDGQLKTRLSQIVTGFQAVLDGEPA